MRVSSFGPLRLFARRGRRYPPGAHAGAVGAARRLHCDARAAVAPKNSLRSLRSLRSNSFGESVHEARCARRPRRCASRRPRNRPCRVPPAAQAPRRHAGNEHRGAPAKARAGSRRRAYAQPTTKLRRRVISAKRLLAEAKSAGLVDRARSAPRQLTRRNCLTAVSTANEGSFSTGPRDRASQGTLAQRGQASKRRRLPARAFARADARTQSERSRTAATGRQLNLTRSLLNARCGRGTPRPVSSLIAVGTCSRSSPSCAAPAGTAAAWSGRSAAGSEA